MSLTIDTFASQPRWEMTRTLALPGWSRGDALGPWGDNLTRRFGGDALRRVRQRLPAEHARIAPVLTARDTLPVHAQLLLTEAICDEFLGGDLRALYPLLIEDTRAGIGRIQLALVKTMGPHRALAHGARGFRDIYDRGSADADTARGHARIVFRGSELFAHPTWRVLQLFATGTVIALAGGTAVLSGEDLGEDAFAALATW
jgi:hypothetical protein